MKKILQFVLVLVLCTCMAGCGMSDMDFLTYTTKIENATMIGASKKGDPGPKTTKSNLPDQYSFEMGISQNDIEKDVKLKGVNDTTFELSAKIASLDFTAYLYFYDGNLTKVFYVPASKNQTYENYRTALDYLKEMYGEATYQSGAIYEWDNDNGFEIKIGYNDENKDNFYIFASKY